MSESDAERAARLGAFLDQPPRENTDARLGPENRYTKLGTIERLRDIPIALCKSCCVLVPDFPAYRAIHEQRFHDG